MRLGRRLSAGIAEDPPAPPETPVAEEALEDAVADSGHRDPAEHLVDR